MLCLHLLELVGCFLFSDSVGILSAVYTDINEQNYSQIVTIWFAFRFEQDN